jgi:hypothetical protein
MIETLPTDDEGYSPLEAGVEPPDADEELALEDELAGSDDALIVEQEPPAPLGRTPAIDFVERTFVPSLAGGPLMLYGLDTLGQWVEKCLRTRRGAHPAVHPDFGVDITPSDLMDGGPADPAELAEAEDDWTRALLVHPRISEVDEWDFDIDPDDDAVYVTFRVVPEGDSDNDDPEQETLTFDRLRLTTGVTA